MNTPRAIELLIGLALASSAFAQTQNANPPSTSATDAPSAASSPHQREATSTQTPEAPAGNSTSPSAAASPHQGEAMQSDGKAGPTSPSEFVQKAALAGMTEVELGKLALDKSKNEAVRSFAERMVQDHGKANTELGGIAQKKGIEVPKQLDANHRKMVQDLSAKSGDAFDSAYAQHMAGDHSKALGLFKSASTLPDADLASFAKKTLPTLVEHKKMADSLQTKTRTASASQ